MNIFRKRRAPAGSIPGTLNINHESPQPIMRAIRYTADAFEDQVIGDVSEMRPILNKPGVCWIDVQGLGNESVLRAVSEVFQLHPLTLEDVVNVPQRPKAELHDEYVYIVTQMASLDAPHSVISDQVSMILGSTFVLTFQERHGDILDPVRNRIAHAKGLIRKMGADYLAYAILDTLIDGYYPILEDFGEELEDLEDEIVASPHACMLPRIHYIKRELLAIRRVLWPMRESIAVLSRDDSRYVGSKVRVYLRDCHDHCVQMIDVVETYRELTGGLMDLYLSGISNRQNEIMKVLTIMASIFIPLTFLAGLYGMNFDHMPELHRPWAYPALLVVMAVISAFMVGFFYRKGWIGNHWSGGGPTDEDRK